MFRRVVRKLKTDNDTKNSKNNIYFPKMWNYN